MPRITVSDGPSNAGALPGEVGHFEHEPATGGVVASGGFVVFDDTPPLVLPPGGVILPEGWVQVDAPEAAHEARDAIVTDPVTPYGSMKKAELVEEARARELPVGGSKDEIAARLAEHDAAQGGDTP